ncbi:MAG: hypothetical protein IPI73_24070 [Betaproteobacteria bacterium]|nr:hypothetical protein [Betaproteobacteria bacterium]
MKGTGNDAFVTRLNAALTTRLQSTYLGGNADDLAYALAIHPATGEVYVAGYTEATDFPKVTGAEQTVKGAGADVFVSRYSFDLLALDAVPDASALRQSSAQAGSMIESAPALITGIIGSVPISVLGGHFASTALRTRATACAMSRHTVAHRRRSRPDSMCAYGSSRR